MSYNRSHNDYVFTTVLLDLLFGTYRQRALTQLLLHPDCSYHVRELARLTGTTPGTLHKELARLAAAGLLLREQQGNQVRYRANRECPVFPELAGLFRKTSGAVSVLADALHALEPAPELAVIFGSLARGEENERSDIDLLVIGDTGLRALAPRLRPVAEQLGREINPVTMTAAEFARGRNSNPLLVDLLGKEKLFVKGSADELERLA